MNNNKKYKTWGRALLLGLALVLGATLLFPSFTVMATTLYAPETVVDGQTDAEIGVEGTIMAVTPPASSSSSEPPASSSSKPPASSSSKPPASSSSKPAPSASSSSASASSTSGGGGGNGGGGTAPAASSRSRVVVGRPVVAGSSSSNSKVESTPESAPSSKQSESSASRMTDEQEKTPAVDWEDEKVPAVGWSVVDLTGAIICASVAILTIIGALWDDKRRGVWSIVTAILGLFAVALFLLLSDFSGKMIVFSKWSLVFVAITAIDIVVFLFRTRKPNR